jgi:hypothetical protein
MQTKKHPLLDAPIRFTRYPGLLLECYLVSSLRASEVEQAADRDILASLAREVRAEYAAQSGEPS